jgi:hypothetical protein
MPNPPAFGAALNVVGPALLAHWDANNAFNAAPTQANLNAAVAASTNAANVITAHLGSLGPGGPALLNSVNGVLADLHALMAAAQALVQLSNS